MESATIVIAMVAKFMITISFAIIYAFSAEQFPTTLRSVCIGVCGLFANIGIMVTPQIVALVQYSSSIPLVIFGVMSILGGVVVLYLPETLNESLPETSIEANNFGKDQKCWSFSVKRYRKSEVISRVAALDHHEMAPLATKVNGVTDETV
ncbi:PREDICTED: organic cation transporter protein-like [Priapulus caudatus]|uniref:Organic cation transporter protein-like n=1 Tax=Priapulus caudatus TaxID=37621 RepID=A0ABM1FAP4_PRICU|nr:PREDICTED: organic cation transporter protein-like [Priapulus caudatus]